MSSYATLSAEDKGLIFLPKAKMRGVISLEEAISKRRSVRTFKPKELNVSQISQLLWSAQGVTNEKRRFRAAPSAGALFPIDIYIAKRDGIFHYERASHGLLATGSRDVRAELAVAALGQSFISEAPVSIIIAAVRNRVTSRYGERGNRYIDIEVGHVAENIHLQAVALGLASVPVGAFDDGAVTEVLALPSGVEPLYIIPVGYEKL